MAVAAPTSIHTNGRDGYGKLYTLLDAVTVDTTTDAIEVLGMKAITIEFTEGGTVNNRSGVLTMEGSIDGGTTFRAYNMLVDNLAATNAQTRVKLASKTRATAGTDLLGVDLEFTQFTHVRFVLDITDGGSPTGNYTLKALATR